MKRLTCSQVVATVFVLVWTTCPMAFAVERGKQEGKRVAGEVVPRAVDVVQTDSLFGQFGNMNIGTISVSDSNAATASQTFTLVRPEGTFVFSNVTVVNNNMSGHLVMFDPAGQKVAEVDILRVAFTDDNRLDFSTVTLPTADAPAVSVVGSMVGITSTPGAALLSASADGGDSVLFTADFGGTSSQATASAGLVSPIILASFPALPEGQGGVASTAGNIGAGAVVIGGGAVGGVFGAVAAGLFVAVTCLAFGWFGCN